MNSDALLLSACFFHLLLLKWFYWWIKRGAFTDLGQHSGSLRHSSAGLLVALSGLKDDRSYWTDCFHTFWHWDSFKLELTWTQTCRDDMNESGTFSSGFTLLSLAWALRYSWIRCSSWLLMYFSLLLTFSSVFPMSSCSLSRWLCRDDEEWCHV